MLKQESLYMLQVATGNNYMCTFQKLRFFLYYRWSIPTVIWMKCTESFNFTKTRFWCITKKT